MGLDLSAADMIGSWNVLRDGCIVVFCLLIGFVDNKILKMLGVEQLS